MSEEKLPVIGQPGAPAQALAVAVSDRFADVLRAARRRQLVRNALVLASGLALASLAVVVYSLCGGNWRGAAFVAMLAFGALLCPGAVVRRRPLELGLGILARDGKGGVRPVQCARGLLLLIASAFHEAVEGFAYGTGLFGRDPAAELAAWIVLALSPPHGPGEGKWVSLEGVGAAGFFGLPEDLRAALDALASRGLVSVDRGRYPPRVRLEPDGPAFLRGLAGGSAGEGGNGK